jgi:hypothetical protein
MHARDVRPYRLIKVTHLPTELKPEATAPGASPCTWVKAANRLSVKAV